MALELHVWGPAFGLPSIDAECIATIAYLQRIVPKGEWVLVADYDTSVSPRRDFPTLVDNGLKTTGYSSIVSYLRDHRSGAYNLDYNLTHQQQTDRTAFLSFLESTASPLIDLYLYVCSENYSTSTSSAYTAILPWYANYTIPPKRRHLARARTAHMGLGSLDVQITEVEGKTPGSGTASSEFEAARRAAEQGVQPKAPSIGRRKGIGGLLSAPIYAARFKLDALSNELLEPLSDLLGKKDYLLEGDKPSSLDCLCFGYLALLFYPPVPQAWVKETIQTKYPRIASYIRRLRGELLGNEELNPADIWAISSSSIHSPDVETTLHKLGMHLPWRPRSEKLGSQIAIATREVLGSLPMLSSLQQNAIIQAEPLRKSRQATSSLPSPVLVSSLLGLSATLAVVFAGLALQHRRSPRDGPLIFWALRPNGAGEAENIFSVLSQLPSGAFTSF